MPTASDVLGLSGGPPWRADLASWAAPKWDERGYPRPWIWEKALALDASPCSAFIHCVTVDKLLNLFEENPVSALSEKGGENPISKLHRLKQEKPVPAITNIEYSSSVHGCSFRARDNSFYLHSQK